MIERGLAYDISREKDQTPLYRRRQIETHIGERLNTLLSRNTYQIKEGKIYGLGLDEPFLDVMKSGVGHGGSSDRAREEAEVIGFSKIQDQLAASGVPDRRIMVSISPKGDKDSVYQHNFYDIFIRRGKQIEARRYSAGLTWEEFGQKAKNLGFKGNTTDVSFLSNPISVTGLTPEEIHQFFHKEHEYLSEEDYLLVLKICLPSILYYAENPSDKSFNAVLNKADFVRENLEDIKEGKLAYLDIATGYTVDNWGRLPVRQTMTGCGFSGGASTESSPFSVSDLGEDKYGSRKFNCPHCGEENTRPKDKLIANCQHCHKDVRC